MQYIYPLAVLKLIFLPWIIDIILSWNDRCVYKSFIRVCNASCKVFALSLLGGISRIKIIY